jgi:hypothetical protein
VFGHCPPYSRKRSTAGWLWNLWFPRLASRGHHIVAGHTSLWTGAAYRREIYSHLLGELAHDRQCQRSSDETCLDDNVVTSVSRVPTMGAASPEESSGSASAATLRLPRR